MNQTFRTFRLSFFIGLFAYGVAGSALAANDAHEHERHGDAVTTSELQLNEGERWDMDDHTRTMFSKMEQTFFQADHSTLASLNAMGTELDAQLEQLINGCTMQGAAHEQLHLFLTAYMPTIKALVDAKDYDKARDSAIRLKGQLEGYKHYFK